jgi:hypothetical protein
MVQPRGRDLHGCPWDEVTHGDTVTHRQVMQHGARTAVSPCVRRAAQPSGPSHRRRLIALHRRPRPCMSGIRTRTADRRAAA